MDTIPSSGTTLRPQNGRPANPPGDKDAALMDRAKDLEAAFLAEMLGHAGLDADGGSGFGGGIGEEQFASFLRQEQARLMVDRGGIGLAEALFRAMGGTGND
ncbi:MAG: rod-binding protein [Fuscovulum sp.]|jgi:flagellar protein FlgJ|nr:rod-binding protein [Fuscovulum sp.]